MFESLNSLQKVKVGISKEDLVGGVVYGQSMRLQQLGCDDGTDIASVHASSADICCVTPVGPVQPSGIKRGQEGRKHKGGEQSKQRINGSIVVDIYHDKSVSRKKCSSTLLPFLDTFYCLSYSCAYLDHWRQHKITWAF